MSESDKLGVSKPHNTTSRKHTHTSIIQPLPLYDPIKMYNKRRLLNEVAIKCRYDLMYINEIYRDEGKKFHDNNLFTNIHNIYDKDIKDFGNKIKNFDLDKLTNRARIIKDNVLASGVFEAIDSMDHTSMLKIKNASNRSHEREDRKKESLGEIKQFYKDYKLKEKRKIMKKNRELFAFVGKSVKLNRGESKDGSSKIDTSSSQHDNVKLKKIRMQQYGKLPEIRKREAILTNENMNSSHNLEEIDYSHGVNVNTSGYGSNNSLVLFSQTEPNEVQNITEVNANGDHFNTDASILPEIRPSIKEKEFSNISLNSQGMELIKNCLFSPEEIKQRRMIKNVIRSGPISSPNSKKSMKPVVKSQLSRVLLDSHYPVVETTQLHTNTSKENLDHRLDTYDGRSEETKDTKEEFNSKLDNVRPNETKENNHIKSDANFSVKEPFDNINNKISANLPKHQHKRITFNQRQNAEARKLLSNQQTQLDEISKKIENEFFKFNNRIDKVMYIQDEDDLYFKQNLFKSSEDTIKENMKKYLKRKSANDINLDI